MSEWKVQSGRLSFFPPGNAPSGTISAIDTYRAFWAREPDSFQRQDNPLSPSVAQGRCGNLLVGCVTHPTRIDLNFTPLQPPNTTPGTPPVFIEDTASFVRELRSTIDRVSTTSIAIEVGRLAVFVQFGVDETDVKTANQTISAAIPDFYRPKLSNEESFALQVNLPVNSNSVPDLMTNRLVKWSVDKIQFVLVNSPVGFSASVIQTGSPPRSKPRNRRCIPDLETPPVALSVVKGPAAASTRIIVSAGWVLAG